MSCTTGASSLSPTRANGIPTSSASATVSSVRSRRPCSTAVPQPKIGDLLEAGDLIERAIIEFEGPSLSGYLADAGTRDELAEFVAHRAAYQRKEADPHTWAIPRYAGRSRAALIEIQMDEYGNGAPGEAHADLFAATMAALGLDPTYGVYLDRLPATTLATSNLVSMFGLHRRWLPALLGHLALFEMTSVEPMRRYAETIDRHDVGPAARRFYDVHVEADAHHGPLARHELVGGYLDEQPQDAATLVWGARALLHVEARFADHLLTAWANGRSSLRALDQGVGSDAERSSPRIRNVGSFRQRWHWARVLPASWTSSR